MNKVKARNIIIYTLCILITIFNIFFLKDNTSLYIVAVFGTVTFFANQIKNMGE